jgi:hypothetical protein
LLTVSRSFMNVANSVLWRMTVILKANKVNLFVSYVLFVFWYHSQNFLDTPRTIDLPNVLNPNNSFVHFTYNNFVKLHAIPWYAKVPYILYLIKLFSNEWPDDGLLQGRNM